MRLTFFSFALVFPLLIYGQGVLISGGAYVNQTGGTMIVKGNWTNNGSFSPGSGTVLFSDTAQTISGSSLNNFYDMTITSGNIVRIAPQVNVTVGNTLTNNSDSIGLVLKSTSAGTGSIIHNTADVRGTVERYMTPDRWHIISTSLSGQSIPLFVTTASNSIPTSGSNYGLCYYSESGGGWVYYTDPASGVFNTGTGYLIRHTNDDAVSILGAFNVANADMNVTRDRNGWNCIGNPFPCSIGVREDASTTDNFLDYNASALDPSYAVLYLWDEPAVRVSGVTYYKLICNASFSTGKPIIDQAYLQPGQGFLIKAAGAGTVTFTTGMRLHENSGSYFKSSRPSWPGINLTVSTATKTASTAITFHWKMTPGLDITYDAGLFGGDPNFRLYSRLAADNGINFMLQCLPDENFESFRIPLGLDFTEGGTVTFSSEIEPLPSGINIVLEDSLLGTYTNIDMPSATYTANVNPNTSGIGRFFLNINNTNTLEKYLDFQSLDIYADRKKIIITGPVYKKTNAYLYDLSGRLIRIYDVLPSNYNILPADGLMHGVYIIKLWGENSVINKRLLLVE